MSDINQLNDELRVIIADTQTPIVVRATQIVDDLMGRYADLIETDPNFQAVGEMAVKIKTSGATEGENGVWWGEVIRMVHTMLDS